MKFVKAVIVGLVLSSPGWGDITSVGTFPAGTNGQVQYNDRNDFGASSNLTYSTTTLTLSAPVMSMSTAVINGVTYTWPNTAGTAGYTLNLGAANSIVFTAPVSPVGGGGASSLAVNLNGVQITSPTVAINAVSPLIVTSVGGGTTAQISVDPSSVTMHGPLTVSAPVLLSGGAFSLDKSSVTLRGPDPTLGGDLSGTISNATVNLIDISAKTNLAANAPITLFGDVVGIDKSSATLLGPSIEAAELPADGYASTYVNVAGDTMTGQLTVTGSSITVTGSNGIRSSYHISGGSLAARNLSNTLVAVDANGVLISTTIATTSASNALLGISSGSATSSVVVSSPTSNVVVDSNTFVLALQGTTTAFLSLSASSVTLRGPNVINLQSAPQGAGSVFNVSSGTANDLNATTMTVTQDLIVGDDATVTGGLTVNGGSGITVPTLTANRCVQTDGSGRLTSTSGDCSNAQVAILSTSTLQSGATFYVSSGTVRGPLKVTNATYGGMRFTPGSFLVAPHIGPADGASAICFGGDPGLAPNACYQDWGFAYNYGGGLGVGQSGGFAGVILTSSTAAGGGGSIGLHAGSGIYQGLYANPAAGADTFWELPSADASGCWQSNGSGALSITACGTGSGYAVEPATVTFNLAKGVTSSTLAVTGADGASVTYGLSVGSLTFTGSGNPSYTTVDDANSYQIVGTSVAPTQGQCLVASSSHTAIGVACATGSGVTSINASDNGPITGAATLLAGTNVTLSQSGSTITINSSGSGGASSGTVSSAVQYQVPFYSVAGSSNVLNSSANFTNNGTTITITGQTISFGNLSTATWVNTYWDLSQSTSVLGYTAIKGPITYGYTLLIGTNTVPTTYQIAVSTMGHFSTQASTTPALSSCGTQPTITGTDIAGTVTAGSGSTGCIVTFAQPYKTLIPHCVVSAQSVSVINAFSYTVSLTAITASQTDLGTGKFDYVCIGGE